MRWREEKFGRETLFRFEVVLVVALVIVRNPPNGVFYGCSREGVQPGL